MPILPRASHHGNLSDTNNTLSFPHNGQLREQYVRILRLLLYMAHTHYFNGAFEPPGTHELRFNAEHALQTDPKYITLRAAQAELKQKGSVPTAGEIIESRRST